MADRYVRSTDGNNADSGATWALAKIDLTGVAAIDTAGDRLFISQSHAESTGSAITINLAGTPASPVQLLCGNDAAEPPTALATTATVTTTVGAISVNGSVYAYGISFISAERVNLGGGTTAAYAQTWEQCAFSCAGTGINAGGATTNFPTRVMLKDCTFKIASAGQTINCNGMVFLEGGGFDAASTAPTAAFAFTSDRTYSTIHISGFDFSNAGTTFAIFKVNAGGSCFGVIRNSKFPSSWSGSLVSGTFSPGQRAEMYNCDSGDTNYRIWVEDYTGSVREETIIVRTGGASDGTTPLSWKMVSSANAEYPLLTLRAPEIVIWNETVGSAITVTVECITDNVTLTDAEAWIEVQYLGTSGFPLGSFISDAKADVLATAANQTSSSETWTTTGLTTPVKQKLSVTFTPQEKGFLHITPNLAKASTTMYVCPKPAVA